MAIEDWTFQNISRSRRKISLRSIDHAIELFMAASGEDELAVTIEFSHHPKGIIISCAGQEFASLSFDPTYDPHAHSLAGFKRARSGEPVTTEDMLFEDSTGVCSSFRAESLLNILDAIRGIRYILEHHDYPDFFEWQPGC